MHTGNLKYSLLWCTKYRRPVLDDIISNRLKELIIEKCKIKKFDLQAIGIMPDHVHVVVEAPSNIPVKYIANQLKGYTSNRLRKEFKILRTRLPTLWTRSYYAGTIGHVSEEEIKKYIENQKNI